MSNSFFANSNARPLAMRNTFGAFNNYEGRELSVEEAIKEAKCNYEVDKMPLIRVTPEMLAEIEDGLPVMVGSKNIITTHCATTRLDTNTTLGIVGSDYGVVQNTKAFEFINFIQEVGGKKPIIETAGALGDGERMYVTCRLGDDMFLDGNKDAVKQYVVFTNTHDGSGAVMVFFTPIRVVCQNTLNMAIRDAKNKLVFKHTKHVNTRLDWEVEENRKKALQVLGQSVKFSETFINQMMNLKTQIVTEQDVQDFATRIYVDDAKYKLYLQANHKVENVAEISTAAKNKIEKLRQSIDFGVGQDLYRGTKLWLLNGITTMLHNDRAYKSYDDEFKSLMYGDGLKKVQLAYDFLTA